jgi:lactobin A/cerein 7B family class IIb bacteriocin
MNLENLNLVELNAQEVQEVDGGFVPIVVWGVVIGAEYVAGLFFAGVGIGAAVAQGQK